MTGKTQWRVKYGVGLMRCQWFVWPERHPNGGITWLTSQDEILNDVTEDDYETKTQAATPRRAE